MPRIPILNTLHGFYHSHFAQARGFTSKKSAQKIFDKVKGQLAHGSFKLKPNCQMPFEKLVEEFWKNSPGTG